MNIAYLLITHKDPEFAHRLATTLTRGTGNHVFVHVDAKVPIGDFDRLESLANVHLLGERLEIYWGDTTPSKPRFY